MKTCIRIALFLSFCLGCNAQVLLKLNNDSLFSYSYSGGDEFNTPHLNENIWSNGLGWSRVLMSQDLSFSPDNVKCNNGLLNLVASKRDSLYILNPWEIDSSFLKKQKRSLIDNKFLTKYSAGCIISRQKLHYGFYEIRFKVEEGRGVWPAFWFYGGNKNEEIDIFELKDEKNDKIHVDTHCPYGCDDGYKNNLGFNTNWGGWLPVSNYLHDGFNIMALEWKENELIWYINGFPLAYFKGSFPNPMNLYLNTSVAKDGGAFKPGPNETTKWPNTYSVDYFRTWLPTKEGDKVVLKKNDEFYSSVELIPEKIAITERKSGYIFRKKELNKIQAIISLSRTSKNQLNLIVLGTLRNSKATVTIKRLNGDTILTNFEKEIKIDLSDETREFEILIKTKNKQISKIIKVQD